MTRKSDAVIREVKKRETVQIHLPDNGILEGPRGSQLETFLKVLIPPHTTCADRRRCGQWRTA